MPLRRQALEICTFSIMQANPYQYPPSRSEWNNYYSPNTISTTVHASMTPIQVYQEAPHDNSLFQVSFTNNYYKYFTEKMLFCHYKVNPHHYQYRENLLWTHQSGNYLPRISPSTVSTSSAVPVQCYRYKPHDYNSMHVRFVYFWKYPLQ